MTCSCKAGNSQACKHIVGVWLYCNRKDLNSLELISSTDKKCLWKRHKQPVMEQFEAQPTKTFCCVSQERLMFLPTNIKQNITFRLINCNKDTAIAKHCNRNVNILSTSRAPMKDIQNNILLQTDHGTNLKIVQSDYIDCIVKNAEFSKVYFLQNMNCNLADCCTNIYAKKLFVIMYCK